MTHPSKRWSLLSSYSSGPCSVPVCVCMCVCVCVCVCQSCFGQSIQLHDHRLQTAGSTLTERPPTRLGLDTPRRNSSDGLLYSVKSLLKQTVAKWKPKCKYPRSGFSTCLRPSDLINGGKTTANKKNGSQNQNQVAPVSGVPQRSNTMRFRLRAAKISQEIAGGEYA